MRVSFFVPGVPVAKGSAKAFVIKGKNSGKPRAIVTQTNSDKQKPWASLISFMAKQEMGEIKPLTGPIMLGLQFTMPRPKAHYRTGKNAHLLRDDAPHWHISKPDLDKLIRCVKDALTGVAWVDDSQVCLMSPEPDKTYGDEYGVRISIRELIQPR